MKRDKRAQFIAFEISGTKESTPCGEDIACENRQSDQDGEQRFAQELHHLPPAGNLRLLKSGAYSTLAQCHARAASDGLRSHQPFAKATARQPATTTEEENLRRRTKN
jgi:hypothetical protein